MFICYFFRKSLTLLSCVRFCFLLFLTVTNQAAALAQARELQRINSPRETSTIDSSTSQSGRGLNPAAQISGVEISSSTAADRGDFHPARPLSSSMTAVRVAPGGVSGSGDSQRYVGELVEQLDWAMQELQKSQTVEYSIQLCQLVKSCADAISSVKSAFE